MGLCHMLLFSPHLYLFGSNTNWIGCRTVFISCTPITYMTILFMLFNPVWSCNTSVSLSTMVFPWMHVLFWLSLPHICVYLTCKAVVVQCFFGNHVDDNLLGNFHWCWGGVKPQALLISANKNRIFRHHCMAPIATFPISRHRVKYSTSSSSIN